MGLGLTVLVGLGLWALISAGLKVQQFFLLNMGKQSG